MATKEEGIEKIEKIETACEYKSLKTCLEKNNWKKEKCEKEWMEFETLCSKNKRSVFIF